MSNAPQAAEGRRPEMPTRGAVVSVGGSPAPILVSLRRHRPRHVLYFCSPLSRPAADEIHAGLDWHPDRDFAEVARFEELGPCYRVLRDQIPRFMEKWRLSPEEVVVDYTGGTKAMSAALVLAATERLHRFSYIGGDQREKGGLGVTVDGKERVFYDTNPWSELATREIERAKDLWDACLFGEAAGVLRAAARRVPKRVRFETVADIADATAARHRMDFRQALQILGPADKRLAPVFDGADDAGLAVFVKKTLVVCEQCSKGDANQGLLDELLDNALRTARQQRFEDAAARLYRAMEMRGQIWLAEATGNAFVNGALRSNQSLPDALRSLPFCAPDTRGEVKLALEQIYLALDRLGDPRAKKVAADIALEKRSRWRRATERRNTSILAHGATAVGETGFKEMLAIAADFLGLNTGAETNPIPAFNTRWLDLS